jgi:hypothetical protein
MPLAAPALPFACLCHNEQRFLHGCISLPSPMSRASVCVGVWDRRGNEGTPPRPPPSMSLDAHAHADADADANTETGRVAETGTGAGTVAVAVAGAVSGAGVDWYTRR